jgi:hypothetical protein
VRLSGGERVDDANEDRARAIDCSVSAAEYDESGFRSFFQTLRSKYSNRTSLRWPFNSGVTGRLSQQEIQWRIDELLELKARGSEVAGLIEARLQIWRWGKTQSEAADYLGLCDRSIRALDEMAVTALGCRLYPQTYNLTPLSRKRKWRPGIAERILGRKLSSKLTPEKSGSSVG